MGESVYVESQSPTCENVNIAKASRLPQLSVVKMKKTNKQTNKLVRCFNTLRMQNTAVSVSVPVGYVPVHVVDLARLHNGTLEKT